MLLLKNIKQNIPANKSSFFMILSNLETKCIQILIRTTFLTAFFTQLSKPLQKIALLV